MKIRTQISILVTAAALMLPATIAVTVYAARDVERQMGDITAAERLIAAATDLRQIGVETALFHETRAPDQWRRKIALMREQMKTYPVDTMIERAHIERVEGRIALAQKVYPRMLETTGATNAGPASKREESELEARTVTSLFVITQEILDTASELIRLNRVSATSALQHMYLAICTIVLSVLVLTCFAWHLVIRRILKPLDAVEQGTRRIAAGDFASRLELRRDDEIGLLADEFDRMTERVRESQLKLALEADNSQRAERETERLSERLRVATQAARVGIWDYDIVNDSIAWDDVMFSLYGITRERFGGVYEAWRAGLHPDDAARGDAEITAAIAGSKPFDTSFRVVWPNGEIHWIRAVATVRRAPDGTPLRMIGTNWDITEEKKADLAKAEFVSTVSHELRTPLTSISGSLGLVIGGALGEVPAAMAPMLEIAQKNSLRLAHLIDDLLDMEKLAAGKIRFDMQVQPLMPLLEQAVEATRAYAERLKVGFRMTARADAVMVNVDGSRLQQVLANLLSNAAKFSPPDTQVDVAVQAMERSVRVEVSDCGPGVPAQFHSRIFQKFSQADSSDTRKKEGTGLGLAITKELVERMNGLIGFRSEEGQGACFYFELPRWREADAQESAAAEAGLAGPAGAGGPLAKAGDAARLLIVEDDADIALLLRRLFEHHGYRADIAPDAESALKALAQRSYAAISLDLMLPDKSGVMLMRQLRGDPRTEHLPIIVVSAYTEEGRLAVRGEFNAIDWIDKPFDSEQLLRAVERATGVGTQAGAQTAGEDHAAADVERPRCRVLHVEDDADLAAIVALQGRELADFSLARSLAEARRKLADGDYAVVVLDIGLPDGSGWELLPQLRALSVPPAVIVLAGSEATPAQRAAVDIALTKSSGSTHELLHLLAELLATRLPARASSGDSRP